MMCTTHMALRRNLTVTSIPIWQYLIVTPTIRTFIIGTGISQAFFVDVNVYARYRPRT
jgi:hypothetical protein